MRKKIKWSLLNTSGKTFFKKWKVLKLKTFFKALSTKFTSQFGYKKFGRSKICMEILILQIKKFNFYLVGLNRATKRKL